MTATLASNDTNAMTIMDECMLAEAALETVASLKPLTVLDGTKVPNVMV